MGSQIVLFVLAAGGEWHWWVAPLWIVFWVAVIVAVVRLAPWRRRRDRRPTASEILAERFARGEIDAAEYAARRDVLGR
jgi:putative membrane protein